MQRREDISTDHAEDVERTAEALAEIKRILCAACGAPTWELSRRNASEALRLACRFDAELRDGRDWLSQDE
jgi:hypothetical protein